MPSSKARSGRADVQCGRLAELKFIDGTDVLHLVGRPDRQDQPECRARRRSHQSQTQRLLHHALRPRRRALVKAEREGTLREKIRSSVALHASSSTRWDICRSPPGGGNLFFQLVNSGYRLTSSWREEQDRRPVEDKWGQHRGPKNGGRSLLS